jgi:hypothetical protein
MILFYEKLILSMICFVKLYYKGNIVWACAVFGNYPDNLMKLLYIGQFGSGSFEDMEHLLKLHDDRSLSAKVRL